MIPSVVEVPTVKLPLRSIAFAVKEIVPAEEMPAMLLTVPTVRVALLVSVNDAMPVAAIVLSVLDTLLNV